MIMITKEEIVQTVDQLSPSELEQLAQFLAFIKYQSRVTAVPSLDESQLAALYAECAEEDRALAEGISDYGREEYDLASLQVRKLGPGRKSFGGSVVRLEPDVAEVFPDADPVNEALRFLIRITKENKPPLDAARSDA
jgi:hypothetical protein